ncbi:MAG: extracellular solute-binding protein [Burkholderiaceae bacterium]|nr:extracellular solute-binding protein [Burkholderiaceae bacterium]MCZ8177290.1 extracellular solute-binding protein [Burkholderiaceae bacterium]
MSSWLRVWLTCWALLATAGGALAAAAAPVTLPAGIVWETNEADQPIGSADAIRGGTLNDSIGQYPLTLRLMGPNSNDSFAAWNRLFTFDFSLVSRHPVSDRYAPLMATHWAVMPDQRTLYFKLDRDARWSDGKPVTARDYVFTLTMMRSPHIVDPFYNSYAERNYESIDAIDEHTLRIVGKRPSWRPLADYGEIWPTPAHVHTLDADWVKRTTNTPQVVPGPYVVGEMVRGESVTLNRVPNWWGDGKKRFRGLYNFDRIVLRVIPTERRLDYLRRGELDMMVGASARSWNEDFTFPAVRKGWIRRARIMTDWPSGLYGLHMNLDAPIFRNKDFRKAMQYLVNFDRVNQNLMYGEFVRQTSFFEGTEFASPRIKPYGFNPAKAREHLEKAGFRRPAELRARTWWGRLVNAVRGLLFTRTDTDDVLVNDKGERASFTLIHGSKGLERHLTVMQQEFRRAGVDMQLRLLEPGTAFERGLERKYEMTLTSRTTAFYPGPRQYLHTSFKATTNNNNIWRFGTPEVDELIRIYEEDLDPGKRREAMHRIDEIVHDEAFYIPFWSAPFLRVVHWDYLRFPDTWMPPRTQQITDHMVYWIDPARRAAVEQAMKEDKALPLDASIDKDPYKLRERAAAR